MNSQKFKFALFFVVTVLTTGFSAIYQTSSAQTSVSELIGRTDFHGISVDPNDSSRIYLATHHGLFVVAPDGKVERASDMSADFMGFTPHPSDPATIYASGHPSGGGNLGIIISNDKGKTWKKLADGVGGPVDFHQMDVSKADPNVMIGNSRGLQISKDAGRSWKMVGPAPNGTIDIAASGKDADTIYAATQGGIVRSVDGGKSWTMAHLLKRTATMIDVASDGRLYAFQIGAGLIRTSENAMDWRLVSNDFGNEFILHFTIDPSNQQNMYAVTFSQQTRGLSIIASSDGGVTWKMLGKE